MTDRVVYNIFLNLSDHRSAILMHQLCGDTVRLRAYLYFFVYIAF